MIKVIDGQNTIMVDFKNNSNEKMSGQLLTYEISGEACVLANTERIWVPFSNLTEKSQNRVLRTGTKTKNNTESIILKEPKSVIIITLSVLSLFVYFYMRYNL
jgi:hypothetical protein